MAHPTMWDWIRQRVLSEVGLHLPSEPMRRHHYSYLRDRYLTDDSILDQLGAIHRQVAAAQAVGSDCSIPPPAGRGPTLTSTGSSTATAK